MGAPEDSYSITREAPRLIRDLVGKYCVATGNWIRFWG